MPPIASPSQAAYGIDRYGASVALKLMISPSASPPSRPIRIAGAAAAGLPLPTACGHGHSAAPSSTTSSRNDLLTVPCSVFASPATLARGRPAKVLSLRLGVVVRGRQVLLSLASGSTAMGTR